MIFWPRLAKAANPRRCSRISVSLISSHLMRMKVFIKHGGPGCDKMVTGAKIYVWIGNAILSPSQNTTQLNQLLDGKEYKGLIYQPFFYLRFCCCKVIRKTQAQVFTVFSTTNEKWIRLKNSLYATSPGRNLPAQV